MRSGLRYTHPRFMDASFRVRQSGFYGGRWKFKAEWFVRGKPIGVTTKHELYPDKVREFTPVADTAHDDQMKQEIK